MARNPDPQWYDGMYNNRALVPAYPQHLAHWADSSVQARETNLCHLDLAYGDGVREALDVFPAPGAGAPVLVFIHGGYWRSLDKSDHSFVASAFARAGACVVVPNYALCPGTPEHPVTVPQITLQMVRALVWTWRKSARFGGDPGRITVAGHSAGGHLAAMLLACRWGWVDTALPPGLVRNALSISGLHELESIRRTPFLQSSLHLRAADARKASPAWLAAPQHGFLNAVVGGDESAEFLRQNRLIRARWGQAAVPVCEALPGLNHFSVLESLARAGTRLHALALGLLGLA